MPVCLKQLPGSYAIARLPQDAALPAWFDGDGFTSFSRSDVEVSIVCRQERIPADVQTDRDWCCFQLLGPFVFDETGIVLSVIRPLSENGLGIFLISTFDGDMLLVKQADLPRARSLLEAAGHQLV